LLYYKISQAENMSLERLNECVAKILRICWDKILSKDLGMWNLQNIERSEIENYS